MTYGFLGANTPSGFFSLYEKALDGAASAYILKGGPGCGKSTFLKYIAGGLYRAGVSVELFHCSADPFSLDGFFVPKLSIFYVDGTPPHVLEPKYPGVVGNYVNLFQFLNTDGLDGDEIIQATDSCSSSYPSAYRSLRAARDIFDDSLALVCPLTDFAKLKKRFDGVIKRELPQGAGRGELNQRFLSAICHAGWECDFSLFDILCDKVYCLESNYGLSRFVLPGLMNAALERGHDVTAYLSPMNPEGSPVHLIMPELKLGFVTSKSTLPFTGHAHRRLHLDGVIDLDGLKAIRGSLHLNEKTASAYISEAVRLLESAKASHDRLEVLYNPYVDFDGIMALAKVHLDTLLCSLELT